MTARYTYHSLEKSPQNIPAQPPTEVTLETMCICINCTYVDRCVTYHAVETQHQQHHLTDAPTFEPSNPSINVNIRPKAEFVEIEWDVVGCGSFQTESGKWSRLRPGEAVPT